MRRLALIALLLLPFAAAAAMAQDTSPPSSDPIQSDGQPEAPPAPQGKHLIQVLAIGDAIGGGLGAGLTRIADATGSYDVTTRFTEESGLARPEVYDWASTLPKMLESTPYDVVVVMLGANDRQTIRDGDARLAFGTPEWKKAYARQTDLLLDQLEASKAQVVWVAPPPMKDPDYDQAMRLIAGIQKERVEKRGMTFLDLRPQFTAPDGSYTDAVSDDAGGIIKLRARDGVSFFKTGNNRMGELVLAAIEGDDSPEAEKLAGSDNPEAAKTDREQKPPEVPLFGQAVMDAEPYTVQPEGVTANAMLLAAGALGPEAALKTLRDIAPTGSGAERLFKQGNPAPAPAGRADDFTAPAP